MPSPKALANILALTALVAAAPPATYAALLYATDNVHEVVPGTLYRSGQLDDEELRHLVAAKGIRSVLNLRGAHPGAPWYDRERTAARDLGVGYVSIGISAGAVPAMATMVEIADTLRDAPRPILVHCEGGADRSGLASAIYELAVAGERADEAAAQLSPRFLHFPWLGSRTAAMDRAFTLFAANWTPASDRPVRNAAN